jgi:hypothetical protein
MENKKRFICWVHDDKSSFPVYIDPENTILDLQKAIVEQNHPRFGTIWAPLLELYAAGIPETEEAMGGFSFAGLNVLPGLDEIKEHFPGCLPKKIIHLAIKRPRIFANYIYMFVKTGHTAADFLEHPLPIIRYGKGNKSATNCTIALRPENMEKWDELFC